MKFAEQLQPLVTAAGGPTKAAELLGRTRQTINLWLNGSEPNIDTQAGALFLLGAPSFSLPTKTLYISTTPPPPPPKPLVSRQPLYGGFLTKPKHHPHSVT